MKDKHKWQRELAEHWSKRPIEYCEVRFAGCMGTFGLSPAHSRKRRKIENREQYFEVVAACQQCHRTLDEEMSHEDMERTVKKIIAKRESM